MLQSNSDQDCIVLVAVYIHRPMEQVENSIIETENRLMVARVTKLSGGRRKVSVAGSKRQHERSWY